MQNLPSEDNTHNQTLFDTLWQRMHHSLPSALLGVRDWQYVKRRFLTHPVHHYEIVLLKQRFTGQILAAAVLFCRDEVCEIRDIIGDIKHIPLLVQQLRRIAAIWGMQQLTCWISENYLSAFPLQDATHKDLQIATVCQFRLIPCWNTEAISDSFHIGEGSSLHRGNTLVIICSDIRKFL